MAWPLASLNTALFCEHHVGLTIHGETIYSNKDEDDGEGTGSTEGGEVTQVEEGREAPR